MSDQRRVSQWLGFGAGFVALLAVLTWLFMRAGEVSPEDHYAYMQSLRRIQHADVGLNAAVLGSYADLLHNYDPLVQRLGEIRDEQTRIRHFPTWLGKEDLLRLDRKLGELLTAQAEKERKVDLFQRSNAVLRNSLRYFPLAAENYLNTAGKQAPVEFEHFVRGILSLGQGPDREQIGKLREELARLEGGHSSAFGPFALEHLLVHARVILEKRPEVDRLVFEIAHVPTAELQEELTHLYTEAHEDSLQVSEYFRQVLYSVSIMLVLYIAYAIIRIDRDRRNLKQRYEAQLRAEEQLRLYAQVFTSAAEGMTITDAKSRIVAVNPAFCAITGYSAEEVMGQTPALLNSGRQGAEYYRLMWGELLKRGQWHGEIWNRRKDGGIYPEWLSVAAVRDALGVTRNYSVSSPTFPSARKAKRGFSIWPTTTP